MADIDLRSMRHVVTLARVLNFTRAAEELGISQPVLSRSIQAIERRHNVRLFDRDKGGAHLTRLGRRFAERAAAVLHEAESLGDMLQRSAKDLEGELSFGIAPLPASVLLASALDARLAKSPDASAFSAVRSPHALLQMLEASEIEFFISAEAFFPEPAHIKSSVLGSFPTAALVRAGHPILLADFDREAGPAFRALVSGRAAELHFVPASVRPLLSKSGTIIVEDPQVLETLAKTSDGIWLTSPFVALKAIASGDLVVVPCSPEEASPPVRIMFYSLDRRSLSPAALRLRDWMRARIAELWRQTEAA